MICVIAHCYNHYEHWCREVGLNPKDSASVRYVDKPNRLRGLLGSERVEILRLPGWWEGWTARDSGELELLIGEHRKRRAENKARPEGVTPKEKLALVPGKDGEG